MSRLITIIAAAGLLTGCAGLTKTASIAACGVHDSRLSKVVTDPAGVIEYFRDTTIEGQRLAAAMEAGEDVTDDAAAWLRDQLDLIDRLNKCIPR